MENSSRRLLRLLLALALLAVLLASGHVFMVGLPAWADEIQHAAQIAEFLRGGAAHDPLLTTFATYHTIIACIAKSTGASSLDALRLISMLLGALLVIAAFGCAKHLANDERIGLMRAAQVLSLPILLPYLFLVYTDCVALAVILFATWASLARRYWLAALLGALAVALRQNNVVWLLWLLACMFVQERVWIEVATRWRRIAVDALPYVLGLAAFAIFVIVNGGVALGDKPSHPSFHLYDENLFTFLAVAGMVLLPFHIAHAPAVWRAIRNASWYWWAAGSLVVLWFVLGYQATHPYNVNPLILHNRLVHWLNDTSNRMWIALPLLWVWVSLVTAVTDRWRAALWLGATVLSLVPIWMVEHRYYIVPLALWLCVRKRLAAWIEWLLLAWLMGWSVLIVIGLRLGNVYL